MSETDLDASIPTGSYTFDYTGILLEVVLLREGLSLRIDLSDLYLGADADHSVMVVRFLHNVEASLDSLKSGIGEAVHIQSGQYIASRTIDFSFKPDNEQISCLPDELELEYASYSVDDLRQKVVRLGRAYSTADRKNLAHEDVMRTHEGTMQNLGWKIEDGIKRARAEYDAQNSISSVKAAELRGRFLAYEYLKHHLENLHKP